LGRLTKLSKQANYSRRVLIKLLLPLSIHHPSCTDAHARTPQTNPCQLSPNNSLSSPVIWPVENETFAFSTDFWPPSVVVQKVAHETDCLNFCCIFLFSRKRDNPFEFSRVGKAHHLLCHTFGAGEGIFAGKFKKGSHI
jgi:hypothetical protein